MHTLATYHFDKAKSSHILKAWVKEAGISYRQLEDMTMIPYDTITNYMAGRVQDLKLEIIFKIAVATGHSVCELIRLMLMGEEIDFAERVRELPPALTDAVPESHTAPPPPPADEGASPPALTLHDLTDSIQHIRQEQEAVLNRFRAVHGAYADRLQDNHARSIARFEHQIDVINAEHAKHIESLTAAHGKSLQLLQDQVTHFRRRCRWLSGLLALETVGIIALFVVDAFTPGDGWVHGLVSIFGDAMCDTMRG